MPRKAAKKKRGRPPKNKQEEPKKKRGRPPKKAAKKKRGRPPKNKQEEPEKKRGRPPKKAANKKRGRPPKNKQEEPKKKRGRPPKNKQEEPKKKRGRPPKNKQKEPKKKRGRPPKNKQPIVEKEKPLSLIEKWENGLIHKFECRQVVEHKKSGEIGVIIGFMPRKYKTYSIKWHVGKPNKWDYMKGEAYEDDIKKSDKPNPIDIPSWEKYPGPSSQLIAKMKERERLRNEQEKTSKDIDKLHESIEEDLKRKRYNNIEDTFSNNDDDDLFFEEVNDDVDDDELYNSIKDELNFD